MTSIFPATQINIHSEDQTHAFGKAIAASLLAAYQHSVPTNGVTIALDGELGAGKTTLARAILRGLGVTGRIKSPTYAICEPYDIFSQVFSENQAVTTQSTEKTAKNVKIHTQLKAISSLYCYHFDFYRFVDSQSWISGGFSDYFSSQDIRLVEWIEKVNAASATRLTPDLIVQMKSAPIPTPTNPIEDNFLDTKRIVHLQAVSELGAVICKAICKTLDV